MKHRFISIACASVLLAFLGCDQSRDATTPAGDAVTQPESGATDPQGDQAHVSLEQQLFTGLENRRQWSIHGVKMDIHHPPITTQLADLQGHPKRIDAFYKNDNDFHASMMRIDQQDTLYEITEAEYTALQAHATANNAASQTLPHWQPTLGDLPDLSETAQAAYKDYVADAYGEYAEDAGDFWAIIGGDCSWYCGGYHDELSASSTLPDQQTFNYAATNAHDLRYDTAWVEGVEGPGIGQTLIYRFANDRPRITDVFIHNGYIKSEQVWLNNNRVKTLQLNINGKPIAYLDLADTRAEQAFDFKTLGVGPLGRREDGQDLVLTFEIVEVYPGNKHDDTAITEIYFDGIDVH